MILQTRAHSTSDSDTTETGAGESLPSESSNVQQAGRQTIARMDEGRALSPQALEPQRLIHTQMRDFRQLDLFRELRSNLLSRTTSRNPVIVVSGVAPGCGSSFLARNLAASIAFDPERTALLMDCNFQHATLAEDFRLESDCPGLADLFGQPGLELADAIHASGVPRLRVMPAGRSAHRGVEFFASVRMRALLQELKSRYEDRSVVIDAPPALGSPDARILGDQADLIVLVAAEANHFIETIRRAAAVFPANRFAGVVFNQPTG